MKAQIRKLVALLTVACILLGPLPATGYAQTQVCNERQLKNLQVAMLNCTGDSPASCETSTNLDGSENAEKIWNFFTGKGLQPFQVAGMMGNMQAESGFEPRRVQYGKLNTRGEVSKPNSPSSLDDTPPPGATTGYGIVQFTPGTKILPASRRLNMPPGDLAFQVTLIWEQLNGQSEIPEKRAGDDLKQTTNVEDATRSFEYKYERHAPNPATAAVRIKFARDILVRFGGTTASATPSPGSSATPQPTTGCSSSAGSVNINGCPDGPAPASEIVVAQGIRVHRCIADEINRIVPLAKAQGLTLTGGGYRSYEQQVATRRNNCGPTNYDIYQKPSRQCHPPTAIPGNSRHESGAAVDFSCNGFLIRTRSNPCFVFLQNNTSLKNLPVEAWHWSDNGK